MSRIRSLKPEFCKSESIAALPRDVRLHFAMLWTYADDAGRGVDNPKLIKAELWPLDDDVTAETVEGFQAVLEENGRIVRYQVAGRCYFEVVNFGEHQHPQKRSESKLPTPSDGTARVPLPEDSANGTEPLSPVVVGEGRGSSRGTLAPAEPDAKKPRSPDPLFDAFSEEVKYRPATDRERGAWNGALKQLRAAGASADEVHARCAEHRRRWPEATLSLPSLAKHWGSLAVRAGSSNGVETSLANIERALLK